MKKLTLFLLPVLCLFLFGCPTKPRKDVTLPPQSLTTEMGKIHIEKEVTIAKAADNIESTNKEKYNDSVISSNVTTIKEEIKKAPTQELLDAAKKDSVNKDLVIADKLKQIEEKDKQITKLNDLIRSRQVWLFNIAGGALLAACGLAAYLGRIQWAMLLGAVGLFCLGIAQLVGLSWFKYAVFGVGVFGFAAIVIALIMEHKKHSVHMSVDKEAEDYYNVLKKVVPVLDNAYSKAEGDVKVWYEKHILDNLRGKFNDPDKALIHTIRADNKQS